MERHRCWWCSMATPQAGRGVQGSGPLDLIGQCSMVMVRFMLLEVFGAGRRLTWRSMQLLLEIVPSHPGPSRG
jgi:hypothetical protein